MGAPSEMADTSMTERMNDSMDAMFARSLNT